MNPCVKTEGKCNESVNNEIKIMRESNSLPQIMVPNKRGGGRLLIFRFFSDFFNFSIPAPPELIKTPWFINFQGMMKFFFVTK